MKLSTETLYRLCNKYQGASLETLATIIWLCSTSYEEKQILEILEKECKNND